VTPRAATASKPQRALQGASSKALRDLSEKDTLRLVAALGLPHKAPLFAERRATGRTLARLASAEPDAAGAELEAMGLEGHVVKTRLLGRLAELHRSSEGVPAALLARAARDSARPYRRAEWVEGRGADWTAAGEALTRALQERGVCRGQVVAVDAHAEAAGDDGSAPAAGGAVAVEAVLAALASPDLPDFGPLHLRVHKQEPDRPAAGSAAGVAEGAGLWPPLYAKAAQAARALPRGASDLVAITGCLCDRPLGVASASSACTTRSSVSSLSSQGGKAGGCSSGTRSAEGGARAAPEQPQPVCHGANLLLVTYASPPPPAAAGRPCQHRQGGRGDGERDRSACAASPGPQGLPAPSAGGRLGRVQWATARHADAGKAAAELRSQLTSLSVAPRDIIALDAHPSGVGTETAFCAWYRPRTAASPREGSDNESDGGVLATPGAAPGAGASSLRCTAISPGRGGGWTTLRMRAQLACAHVEKGSSGLVAVTGVQAAAGWRGRSGHHGGYFIGGDDDDAAGTMLRPSTSSSAGDDDAAAAADDADADERRDGGGRQLQQLPPSRREATMYVWTTTTTTGGRRAAALD